MASALTPTASDEVIRGRAESLGWRTNTTPSSPDRKLTTIYKYNMAFQSVSLEIEHEGITVSRFYTERSRYVYQHRAPLKIQNNYSVNNSGYYPDSGIQVAQGGHCINATKTPNELLQ